jgi:DNA-binding CsgD family transcriptional regulator
MSDTRLDRKREKELKVFELYQQGLSYRKIAKEARLSLRDVAKYIHRISNKTKSPSTTSVMDEVVLEYRVNLLRSQVRDLKIERENLKKEVNDLRAQKYNLLIQLQARQSELDVVKRDLEYERFSDEVFKDISNQDQITIY